MSSTPDSFARNDGAPPFRVTVSGLAPDALRVHSVTGRETLSDVYSFDVVVTTPAGGEIERTVLGQRAVLVFDLAVVPRAFHGIVASAQIAAAHEAEGVVKVRLRVVPRLWLLKRRKRTRIFQNMKVPDIVAAVLAEAGIGTRLGLVRTYPVREYVTQYEESDYRFVTRLLAEAGIFFHFADGPALAEGAALTLVPGDTVICGDDAACYPPLGADDPTTLVDSPVGEPPTLHFLAMEETHTSKLDKITRFSRCANVRSDTAEFREYDPERPMARLTGAAASTHPFPGDAPSAAAAAAGPPGLEIYEHHGPFLFPKWGFAEDEAPRILRQKRRRAVVADGESGCPDLSPGRRFRLRDHPVPHLDRPYVVTSVEHRGQARPQVGTDTRVYSATFECAPAEVTYVPPRPKRRSVQVALTATVVGPPGEEIHVDPRGQIKVQFHWDRQGKYDDKSSCWIRTMHAFSGAGWGTQFIPRVGMEVVVVFEGGDPDKPLVIGTVYNGTHPPPFRLPEHKTKSGIRTQSTPGGKGSNELSFDDVAGRELVFIHAQRDMEETIDRNRTVRVAGGQSTTVLGGTEDQIGGDQRLAVGGSRRGVIDGEDELDVKRAVTRRVGGALRAAVAEETEVVLDRGLSLSINGTHAVHVGGELPAQSDYFVEGSHALGAKERILIRAEEGVVIACGSSSITLAPDKLVLKAKTIEIEAEESLECSSKKGPSLSLGEDALVLSKKVAIFTEDAALELDTEVKTKGRKIKLGYDPSKPSKDKQEEEPETKPFSVKLADYFLAPYRKKKYHVLVEGLRIEGETDNEGMVTCDVPATARSLQIRMWLKDYPEGPRRDYTINLEELAPPESIPGAKERLKNLGYYQGRVDEIVDADFTQAIAQFQDDHKETHGLEVTSEADEATLAALADVHGS